MLNLLHKSLSEESHSSQQSQQRSQDNDPDADSPYPSSLTANTNTSREDKKGKRVRSGDQQSKIKKRKKLTKDKRFDDSADNSAASPTREEGELTDTADESENKCQDGVKSSSSDVQSSDAKSDTETMSLPPEMPEWGIKLLEIIQKEFRSMNVSISNVEETAGNNSRNMKRMERKLAKVEECNKSLVNENVQLKEKLLEVEFRQR